MGMYAPFSHRSCACSSHGKGPTKLVRRASTPHTYENACVNLEPIIVLPDLQAPAGRQASPSKTSLPPFCLILDDPACAINSTGTAPQTSVYTVIMSALKTLAVWSYHAQSRISPYQEGRHFHPSVFDSKPVQLPSTFHCNIPPYVFMD